MSRLDSATFVTTHALFVALVSVTHLAGCTFGSVDFSAKACPCAPGFACVDAICVAETMPTCEATVTATDFQAAFATPNTIGWSWTPSGEPEALLRYEIEFVDPSNPSEVIAVLGPDGDPALAHYFLPRTGGAEDLVASAFSDAHEPGQTYTARLVVTDTALCEYRTPLAAGTTAAVPPEELVIYEDQATVAGLTPPNYVVTDSGGGGRMLSWQASADAECMELGNTICSQHLLIYPASVDLRGIDAGPFANTAYLEFRLSYNGATPSYYSGVRFGVTVRGGEREVFYAGPFRVSDSAPSRLYQVPLRYLSNADSGVLTTDLIRMFGGFVYNVGVSGQWDSTKPDGEPSTVTIDDIRIRY